MPTIVEPPPGSLRAHSVHPRRISERDGRRLDERVYACDFWRFVVVQKAVAQLAETAVAYPPMQAPASFNLAAVKAQVEKFDPSSRSAVAQTHNPSGRLAIAAPPAAKCVLLGRDLRFRSRRKHKLPGSSRYLSADPTPALDLTAVGFLADAQPPFCYLIASGGATGSAVSWSWRSRVVISDRKRRFARP